MENTTPNHSLSRPPVGSETGTDDTNWGAELNSNTTELDGLLLIRDTDASKSNYEPYTDALFYATDTETMWIGDGSTWTELPWWSATPNFDSAQVNGNSVKTDVATTTTQTGAYTASTDETVLADASGAAFTVTLPPPDNSTFVTVKKVDSSSNAVTVATPNTETIDGASSVSLSSQYDMVTVTSDGTNYFEI